MSSCWLARLGRWTIASACASHGVVQTLWPLDCTTLLKSLPDPPTPVDSPLLISWG
ncbi:unnamed protein product [Effrenium voratum]|nr:unnamed protein product [Effrenium voratum]